MIQENTTQEPPTPALEPGELTDAELALVSGGIMCASNRRDDLVFLAWSL